MYVQLALWAKLLLSKILKFMTRKEETSTKLLKAFLICMLDAYTFKDTLKGHLNQFKFNC